MSENIKKEPPNDMLTCLKDVWIAQTEQKDMLERHGQRLDAIDEHLKQHDACLKPFQLSWCACRMVCAAICSTWVGKAILIVLSILGADGVLLTLQRFKVI